MGTKKRSKHSRSVRSVLLKIAKTSGVFFIASIVFASTNLFARCSVEKKITYVSEIPPGQTRVIPYDTLGKAIQFPNYKRPEESTFLKLPEWFIVYSAHEYADCLDEKNPSNFPYMQSIFQYWDYYGRVNTITEKYDFNKADHLVNAVIGVSYTFEYFLKAIYESSIGRITELTRFGPPTEEERYAQQVADEYAQFLHMIPWYEFPFFEKLSGLWMDTSFFGPSIIRKWERKMILSAEYAGKGIYGQLLHKATTSVFSEEATEIIAWIRTIPEPIRIKHTIKTLEKIDDTTELIALPRYELFTEKVLAMSSDNIQFIEIAGNDEIMLTAISPANYNYDLSSGEVLFGMSIATHPELQRLVIKVPVQFLSSVIQELRQRGIVVEHIYDF